MLNPGSGDAHLESLISMFLGEVADTSDAIAPILFPLEEKMREKVRECGGEKILDELEIPLIGVLFDIEKTGFKINSEGMLEFADALDALARELEERIYVQALGEFNINSPKQLGEVLYVKLGLPCKSKKNKNGFSTDAETLEELRQYSPIIDDILEYRQVTKLKGTYAAALPKLADSDARIHTDFKQALTATGRLSSADPNLQNIPIRTKMGREMRRYFIAPEGSVLIDADYSQIELRLLAHISDDYTMSEAFRSGADIHRKTASAVFGVPEESVNDEMRKRAKAVNFGIVYGISEFSLSEDIGVSRWEAKEYIESYLANYRGIKTYMKQVVEDARESGYTQTLYGRRRYIPELKSSNFNIRSGAERMTLNTPIQGTAADLIKLAMIKVDAALREKFPEAKLVLQVHDELIVECPEVIAAEVAALVSCEMEHVAQLKVPLTAEAKTGKSWFDAK